MDSQTILIVILIIIAANLVAVGIYVVIVLKDLRGVIQKANTILDNFEGVSSMFSNPLGSITGFVSAITEGIKSFKSIRSIREED